ncbi:SRPBCC domain-containing protein [Streptomyces sp. NBC_01198]|uniref:SRPBCC domain-containing protein n=1 Tax=Streptomyces sp. NBC_01198 TaxID=2903769 RepID=UPI002E13CC6C|nr:SRPBCC domain-containing protein [Streptomyces sp. NBC_01198]
MDYDRIERELYIEAPPEVVFDVVSSPQHVAQWWTDEAEFTPTPGDPGWVGFGDPVEGKRERFTVAEVEPFRRFSFRWTHGEGETASPGNSLLVVIELEPSGNGTRLRFTETGFRERAGDARQAAVWHADHTKGWDHFLPRLPAYAERVSAGA